MFSKKFLKKFKNEIESLTYKDGETSKEFSDRVFPVQDYSRLIYLIDTEFVNIASAKKPERALSDLDIYLMIYKKIPDELLGMYMIAGMQRVTWCVNEVVRNEQQMLEKLLIDKKNKTLRGGLKMVKTCIDRYYKPNPLVSWAIGVKGKFWDVGTELRVKFLGGTSHQHDLVIMYAPTWCKYANLKFKFINSGRSDIRITFNPNLGAWSYIGTDCKNISQNTATMNLGWLDESVIEHEFGHAIGLGHEHQNPVGGIKWNKDAVVKDLSGPPNNWDYDTIVHNVIDKYKSNQVIGTNLDPKSIMMYPFPKEWTLDGFSSGFNSTLSEMDKQFIAKLYPKSGKRDVEMEDTPPTNCLANFIKNLWKQKV